MTPANPANPSLSAAEAASAPDAADTLDSLLGEVATLRLELGEQARVLLEAWHGGILPERFGKPAAELDLLAADATEGLRNLADYLALRHHDIRPLQRRLMACGLSSLGRLESRVMPTLAAVEQVLAALTGQPERISGLPRTAFFEGEARLARASERLFGPATSRRGGAPARKTRIMVTMPSDAARTPELARALIARGMDIARINCAHDTPDDWRAMTAHLRQAALEAGRPLRILMDIAGPKIRTAEVLKGPNGRRLAAGDSVRLVQDQGKRSGRQDMVTATSTLSTLVSCLRPGQRVLYDDGRLEAVVDAVADGEAVLRVRRTEEGGTKIRPEKGLNLPDTELGLAPLTAKDEDDLACVIECADMIGYSFVSQPEDIDLLETCLDRIGAADKPIGLVAKIERPEAVRALPALIARAAHRRPFGIMIARGDLAAEIGFERLAEMQEELLWLCEAANVPVIWATQVLETLVKRGTPSRGEMTDAAMSARADCVMLNKGPAVLEGVETLDRLLTRMQDHGYKKAPTLRALTSW